MIVVHDGDEIPVIDNWGENDKEWVYISWAQKLGDIPLESSVWTLDAALVNNGEQFNSDVQVPGGQIFAACNGILLRVGSGLFVSCTKKKVTNTVTAAGGELQFSRSFYVPLVDQ